MHVSLKRLATALALAFTFLLLTSSNALASHFRYGTITWTHAADQGPNTFDITITAGFRRSYFSPVPTIGSTVDTQIPLTITDPTGQEAVSFDVQLTVQSIDAANDWFLGTFTTRYTFTLPGPHTIAFESCCRTSDLVDGNHDQNFFLQALIPATGATTNTPPVGAVLPVVQLPLNLRSQFPIAGRDPEGAPVTFSFAPLSASGLVVQKPATLTLNSSTGLIDWLPTVVGEYAMQVLVSDGTNSTPIDFMMEVEPAGTAFPTLSAGGQTVSPTFTAYVGLDLSFAIVGTVTASGTHGITLQSTLLPPGATLTTALPANGIGTVTTTFHWTPSLGATGQQVLFEAVDDLGNSTYLPVTINIGQAQLMYMSGTVRTFAATDPDFNKPDGDNTIRLVATTLGADSKPVFSASGVSTTVFNATTFNQWFNKAGGQVFSFTLSNANQSDPSVFAFNNPDFLPIGNTPNGQFFTYEVHSYMQYQPGQVLQFSSSDDLWVFINNQLAVDLGGIHAAPRSATLTMNAFAPMAGLVAGQIYRIDYFYAHRGSGHAPQIDVQASAVPICSPLGASTAVDLTTMNKTGTARVVTGTPNALRLTNKSDVGPTGGTAWTPSRITVAQGFQADFDFQVSRGAPSTPAEGFAFVLQASGPTAFGGDAGNLEYAPIDHSLAIEFDSTQDAWLSDPPCQHVSVHTLWALPNSAIETVAGIGSSLCDPAAPLAFDDGALHHAKIVYTPALTIDGYGWLRVWLGSEIVPRVEAQIPAEKFAETFGSAAWLGFTSATAGAPAPSSADVDISNVTLALTSLLTAAPTSAPATIFSGEPGQLSLTGLDGCDQRVAGGGASFAAVMSSGSQTTPVTITDNLDGTYTFAYTPPTAGTWNLAVFLNGTQLATSPYAVTVVENPRAVPTLQVIGGAFTYNGSAHPAAVTLTGLNNVPLGDPVGVTYNGALGLPVYPGNYVVVARFPGNAAYRPATASATIFIGGTIPAFPCATLDPLTSIPANAMTLRGAQTTGTGNGVLRIASTQLFDEATAAWTPFQVEVVRGFSAEFDFQTTASAIAPEGFAFVMQSLSPTAPGIGSGPFLGYSFVQNIAVEFDMTLDTALSDLSGNRVSIHVPGAAGAPNSASRFNELPGGAQAVPNMKDGSIHHAAIVYTHNASAIGTLQVFLDRSATATATVTIPDAALLGYLPEGAAWVGFTSGTNDSPANIDISGFQVATAGYAPATSGFIALPASVNLGNTGSVTVRMRDACGNVTPTSGPGSFAASLTKGTTSTFVTVTDNGNGTYTFSYTPPSAGTWTLAVAYNGVSIGSSPASVVVVPDTTPPVVTPPPAVSANTGPGNTSGTVVIADATLGAPTATDDFGQPVTIDRSGVPAGNSFSVGMTTITYKGTDQAGNSSSVTQLVTVNDNTPPVLTAPIDVGVMTGPADTSGTVTILDATLGAASATDNWSATVAITRSGVPAGNAFPVGITAVTYTAQDAAGNSISAVQHVHVFDTTLPSIAAPPAVTGSTTGTSAVITDATLGVAVATDNSGSVTVTRSGVPPGNVFPIGVTTITYAAQDAAGNTASATQLVTVNDVAPPAITPPPAVTTETGPGNPGATVAVSDATLGTATATDNSGSTIAITRSGVPAGNLFPIGTTTITYSGSDAAGNTGTAIQTVIVNDTTPPVVAAPADVAAGTGPGNPGPGTVVTDAVLGSPSVTDNSGGAVTVTRAGVPNGNVFPIGATDVTYTATDAAGNTAATVQHVVVSDTTAPSITAPGAVTTTTIAAAATVSDAVLGAATASDNSGAASVIARTGVPAENLFPIGTTTITYTATDTAGNAASATQLVVVKDAGAPVVTAPAAISVNTGTAATVISNALLGSATATDNSGVAPTIVRTGVPAGNLFPLGTTTVIYTATDAAGNHASAAQLVTLIDNVAPAITVPVNQTVAATSAAGASVIYPAATATDAGSGLASLGCLPASGSNFAVGTAIVTCTAKDNAGNTSTATFTVTVTPYVSAPDGRMTGDGHINEGSAHYHFVFRASQIHLADYAKVEFWVHDPRACRNSDDDDDDDGRNGDPDRDYGRRHCSPTNVLDSTVVTAVTFSDDPGFSPGNDKKNKAPKPTVDTVQIVGSGRWNGKSGYTFVLNATDQGEPGRNRDTFTMVVKDARGTIVASVSDTLDGGNIQSTRLK